MARYLYFYRYSNTLLQHNTVTTAALHFSMPIHSNWRDSCSELQVLKGLATDRPAARNREVQESLSLADSESLIFVSPSLVRGITIPGKSMNVSLSMRRKFLQSAEDIKSSRRRLFGVNSRLFWRQSFSHTALLFFFGSVLPTHLEWLSDARHLMRVRSWVSQWRVVQACMDGHACRVLCGDL